MIIKQRRTTKFTAEAARCRTAVMPRARMSTSEA